MIGNYIICGVFIALIIGAVFLYKRKCRREILSLNREVEKILAAQDFVGALKKSKLLAPAWNNFEKSLTRMKDKVYSTTDAAEFFSVQTLTHGLNMTFWQAYGGIFTGLGILGTFAGLTFGLYDLNMTSGDIDTLKDSIAKLLSGVNTAFVTSLVGIGAALGYSVVHHALLKSFQGNVQKLADKLDEEFPRRSIEEWLAENFSEARRQTGELQNVAVETENQSVTLQNIDAESQNQTRALQSIDAQAKDQMTTLQNIDAESQNQTRALQSIDAEAKGQTVALKNIGEQVAEAIHNALDEKLADYVQSICAAIDNLGVGGGDKLGEIISGRVGSQMDRFSAALDKFSDSIDAKLTDAQNISNTMNGQLLTTLETLSDNLKRNAADADAKRQAADENFLATLDVLSKTLNEVADNAKRHQETAAKDFDSLLKKSLDNFNAVMAQTTTNSQTAAEETNKQNRASAEKFLSTLVGLNKTLQGTVDSFKRQQENSAANFESLVKNLLADLQAFTEAQKKFLGDAANNNAVQVAKAVVAFREIVNRHNDTTQKTFDRINQLLDETETFLRNVDAAGNSLKQAAEPVKQTTAQLAQNLIETSAQMKTLADANQITRDNLAALTVRLTTFVNNFNGIADQLERATEIITNSLDNYNTKTNAGLTAKLEAFDKSISEAVGHLQNLVEDLSGALEDFNRNRR